MTSPVTVPVSIPCSFQSNGWYCTAVVRDIATTQNLIVAASPVPVIFLARYGRFGQYISNVPTNSNFTTFRGIAPDLASKDLLPANPTTSVTVTVAFASAVSSVQLTFVTTTVVNSTVTPTSAPSVLYDVPYLAFVRFTGLNASLSYVSRITCRQSNAPCSASMDFLAQSVSNTGSQLYMTGATEFIAYATGNITIGPPTLIATTIAPPTNVSTSVFLSARETRWLRLKFPTANDDWLVTVSTTGASYCQFAYVGNLYHPAQGWDLSSNQESNNAQFRVDMVDNSDGPTASVRKNMNANGIIGDSSYSVDSSSFSWFISNEVSVRVLSFQFTHFSI